MSERRWVIYGLVSERSGAVRYVGFSTKPQARLARHLQCSRAASPRYLVHRWIGELLRQGRTPRMVILQRGKGHGWQEAERRWIARLAFLRLLNATPGGEGWHVSPEARARAAETLRKREFTPEHRARISAAKRGVPRTDADKVRARLSKVQANNIGRRLTLSAEGAAARSANGKRMGAVNARAMWDSMTDEERRRRSDAAREQMRRVWAERRSSGA